MDHENERMVAVYDARDILQAHFLKDLLIDEGIEAQVVGDNAPYAGVMGVALPQVWVLEKDQDQARAILMKFEEDQTRSDNSSDEIAEDYGADLDESLPEEE